jgi:hypothetical protein
MTTNDKGVRLEDAIAEMIRRMVAVGHRTAWMRTDRGDVFALVTHHPETAARIYEVLEREGLLCQLDIGRIGEPWTPPAHLHYQRENLAMLMAGHLVCPTCPDATPERCCTCGGEVAEADRWLAPNPYASDIHGDESLHLQCMDCARRSAEDI